VVCKFFYRTKPIDRKLGAQFVSEIALAFERAEFLLRELKNILVSSAFARYQLIDHSTMKASA
jgi:hypothetical protein